MKKFEYYLQLCQELLNKAAKETNPGSWLYQNGFRTPMFMLQGLSKLYAELHNQKKFTKLRERFKLLEDILGKADYYDCFAKEFAANDSIPNDVVTLLQQHHEQEITTLNHILKDKNWLNGKRISKIKASLYEANWLKEEKEAEKICKFYNKEIEKIINFVDERQLHFGNLEKDVHELRRKLRWLSIYPQALRGTVQLTKNKKVAAHLTKYLIPEIVNSPYNKMPDAAEHTYFVMLEQNHFYALSWMIAELGRLKDNGLRAFALQEGLQQNGKLKEQDAFKKAIELLGSKQPKLDQLLKEAENIAKAFFKEKNLQQLVAGTAAVKK